MLTQHSHYMFFCFLIMPLSSHCISFHIFQHRNFIQTSKHSAQLGHMRSFITFMISELFMIFQNYFPIEMNGEYLQWGRRYSSPGRAPAPCTEALQQTGVKAVFMTFDDFFLT